MAVEVSGERKIECTSSRDALWAVVADTNRLNALSGLAPVEFEGRRDSPAPYLVRTKLGPFASEYEEYPFQWRAPEWFQIYRVMKKGPVKTFKSEFRFEDNESGGTTVFASVILTIAPGFLAPLARFILRKSLNDAVHAVQHLDRRTARSRTRSVVEHSGFDRAAEALTQAVDESDKDAANVLLDLVKNGADDELSRIRPFVLADSAGLDRDRMLRTCLVAVEQGLLELTWEVICPSCRTASSTTAELSSLEAHGDCPLCDLSFELDLDFSVEATFHPTPAVRRVRPVLYCTGGPATMPHVVTQRIFEPNESRDVGAPNEPGRYRLFARGGATCVVEIAPGAPETADVQLSEGFSPQTVSLPPGASLKLISTRNQQTHVKLEKMEWASLAASAHRVSLIEGFRERFSAQVLRKGIKLKVQKATLLFSDLSGSTAFYESSGDAAAFAVVQDHFVLLREVIEGNQGTIVKTIGDAVMASFIDEQHALKAAVEAQSRFPQFAYEQGQKDRIALKIGIYSGPCYAVTQNDALDYFGQSVNLAARLEGQSGRHEIIVTAQLAKEATENGWLDGAEVASEFSADLKGVEGEVPLARIRVRR